ncbi:hypothetical protein CH063_08773 [Colletotrichum higginsianum]|uniref:Uncharacterized protein n=1 Tax=Colletotrichum higginsianum (strain IMI 349063) TaxID=759273 RepID=H1VB43_COLHI|nr:hypothetical protein CH063_08773 [Colletotrichum higginsianum]
MRSMDEQTGTGRPGHLQVCLLRVGNQRAYYELEPSSRFLQGSDCSAGTYKVSCMVLEIRTVEQKTRPVQTDVNISMEKGIPTEKQENQQTAVVQIHPAISRPLPFAKLAETNQHAAWWAFLASYGAEPGALTLQNVVDTDTEHRAVLFRTPRPRQDSRKDEHQPMPPHPRIQSSMVVLVQSYKLGDTVKTIVVDVMGRRCRVASTNNDDRQHTMETQR